MGEWAEKDMIMYYREMGFEKLIDKEINKAIKKAELLIKTEKPYDVAS